MNDDIPKNLNINNEIKSKSISLEKWNEEINKIKVNRQDMNKLVLNYLIIEGYKDAVEKFIKETGIVGNNFFVFLFFKQFKKFGILNLTI